MDADENTTRRTVKGRPVRRVRVVVLEGPDQGRSVTAEARPITVGTADGNDLVLTDGAVSRFHLDVERSGDRIGISDHGSTNGTRIGPCLLEGSSVRVTGGTELRIGDSLLRVEDGDVVVLDELGPTSFGELRARAPAMRRLLSEVAQVADKDVPVLLLGESGTGKELLARATHQSSARRAGPFVTVDCASLTPQLFASELFGHERGAFTGAHQRHRGAFERADGGTLFLDEVGELPPAIQAGLLGALERRVVRRLGGTEDIPVDIRLIAATHRDLRSEVNAGAFRLDLYYRLAVALVRVPSLRERPEDIPVLVAHFLRGAGVDGPIEDVFGPEAMRELARHAWPGNVRELRNVVEVTLAMGRPPVLDAHAPAGGAGGADPIGPLLEEPYQEARRALLDVFERRYLTRLLERADGSVRKASRIAKMDRSYLTELLRRHELR